MKIGVFIHLFEKTLFDEFSNYIKNVLEIFDDVTIIFTLTNNEESISFYTNIIMNYFNGLKMNNFSLNVIYIENKGVDIYSFFKQIQFVRTNNIKLDFVLKIHTKISDNPRITGCWRKQLIEPLVDLNNLQIIKNIFENLNINNPIRPTSKYGSANTQKKYEIGYIASQKCIFQRKYDISFKSNLRGILNVCNKFKNIQENYLDFIGGTMFWINYSIINKYLSEELIQYFSKDLSYGKPPSNFNNDIYPEYVFERLITGPLCFNYTNILINDNITENIDTNYKPEVFSFYSPSALCNQFYKNELNNLTNIINS